MSKLYTEILADDDFEPGVHESQFSEAVSVWAWMQSGDEPQTVAAAARAFNTTPQLIRDAINSHPWAFLTGPSDDLANQRIEHDGD